MRKKKKQNMAGMVFLDWKYFTIKVARWHSETLVAVYQRETVSNQYKIVIYNQGFRFSCFIFLIVLSILLHKLLPIILD